MRHLAALVLAAKDIEEQGEVGRGGGIERDPLGIFLGAPIQGPSPGVMVSPVEDDASVFGGFLPFVSGQWGGGENGFFSIAQLESSVSPGKDQPFSIMEAILRSDVFKITVYTVSVIIVGALLTPPLYWVGTAIYESGVFAGKKILGTDLHDELRRADLARYFNRAMMVAALVGLWPAIRWLGGKPQEFLQLDANPRRWWHLGGGFVLAGGGLLLLGWWLMSAGVFVPNPKHRPAWEVAFAALGSGLTVAAVEEFFFRGCLMGLALRTAGRNTAWAFVAVFFAAVHFLKPPEDLVMPEPITWTSGFWLTGNIFHQFTEPVFIAAEFLTLLLVGGILGFTRLRTRSLWLAIGLHGGWVFGIKFFAGMTRRAKGLEDTLPWIGKDLKSGLAAVFVVALTGAVVWGWMKWQERERGDALAGSN